jgi:hypothetical protein
VRIDEPSSSSVAGCVRAMRAPDRVALKDARSSRFGVPGISFPAAASAKPRALAVRFRSVAPAVPAALKLMRSMA